MAHNFNRQAWQHDNRNRLGFGSSGEKSPFAATRRVENLNGFCFSGRCFVMGLADVTGAVDPRVNRSVGKGRFDAVRVHHKTSSRQGAN